MNSHENIASTTSNDRRITIMGLSLAGAGLLVVCLLAVIVALATTRRAEGQGQAPPVRTEAPAKVAPAKWEYKLVDIGLENDKWGKKINDEAEDGWELVTATHPRYLIYRRAK